MQEQSTWREKISLYAGISIALLSTYTTWNYRTHWTSTTEVFQHAWEVGGHKKTACALFKEYEGEEQYDKAAYLLEAALQFPPDTYCCLNSSRFGMVIDNPEVSIFYGEMGLQNGCTPTVEIYSPLSMSYLLVGDLQQSKKFAMQITEDPYHFQPLIWTTLDILGESTIEKPNFDLTEKEKEHINKQAQSIVGRIQGFLDQ